ncbi:phosphoenolpyruvate carboxykinase (GTP) [Candidatus Woesearchaeota archaeon]|nr:phosphoenolpyruvate carboxykinase (GTP) [Candidatus Woesearchaeota archaeon]
MDDDSRKKLEGVKNKHVEAIVERYAGLCKPDRIVVLDGSKKDLEFARAQSVVKGEETPLRMGGHTVHFDGYYDQGREAKNTRVLLPKGQSLSKSINTIDKEEGLKEVLSLLEGSMKGKEMVVAFFCLGPENSMFSIPALQLTDSYYVLHSECILYRQGYDEFKRLKGDDKFFHFVHSAGELDERKNTKNVDKRRIYIDLEEERVFTVNNQYAGNSVGLKKLALRLAISKANKEDWLCEHMFIMGARPLHKDRVTYFTGAFPSSCGKTSTAMIPNQSIIGDDIAYLKKGGDGRAYAANVEQGIFGIIQDINPVDDPVIYKALTTPRELIMSNILVKEGVPYWLGMGQDLPEAGINFSGEWRKGMNGPDGKPVLPAHKNARYTIRISELENVDEKSNDPKGVPVSGIIYGGRDSDTSPPVVESLSWSHGVFIAAAVESETTAAKIGSEGIRAHDPMANMDFLVVPLGKYIENHLKFGDDLDYCPRIFATNYFLKEGDKFLNDKVDKKVWLLWMEGRVHGEYEAIETPIGFIPKYEDVKTLFRQIFKKEYTKEQYDRQFSIRIKKLVERLDRIENIYAVEEGVPEVFHAHVRQQKERLLELKKEKGKEVVKPEELA